MRKLLLVPVVALAAMLNVSIASHVLAQSELTDGLVTKIDASASKITIKHGPMKKFEMEDGMTMVYHVKDAAVLSAVKPGDKVKFDAEHINGQFIVTKIQKVK